MNPHFWLKLQIYTHYADSYQTIGRFDWVQSFRGKYGAGNKTEKGEVSYKKQKNIYIEADFILLQDYNEKEIKCFSMGGLNFLTIKYL